jgi:hypothetical protein
MIEALPARFRTACARDSICAIMVSDHPLKEEKLDLKASAGVA